ncbi:MAG TPA: APC family permease [Myxococcales bacterium]|jgi:amino acid transporter|nr:APC family permease [Myxococcales bacterium]
MEQPAPDPGPSSVPPPGPEAPQPPKTRWQRFKRMLLGGPKDIQDPQLFHALSLAAFLAWVGLGADGLSSSSYGPEEAFKNLGQHQYLAIFLALATAVTVFVISAAYDKIIEHFPFGGGGYIVASRLLGPNAGVVSGAALLIDYVLTCTTSVAAGGEAIFSNFPPEWHSWKLPVELVAIALLTILNLRGVKESIRVLLPIFVTFLVTHVILIGGSVGFHLGRADDVARQVGTGLSHDLGTMGFFALALLFLRAYSLGAGTYTGIEAVSNGLSIMREPRVLTGKRTMVYMSTSLAITAGGIILAYLLMGVSPVAGKTMNYTLAEMLAGGVHLGPLPLGHWYVVVTIASEALLLFVAAQAGFIAGPRVMANLAHDSFLPHRFSALSDRLTMQNGVLLMGGASFLMLLYTRGSVDALVVMYAINVFVTFSLSQLGMIKYWRRKETRARHRQWRQPMVIAVVCFVLCAFILVVNLFEKFTEGAWLTVVITGAVVAVCLLIKRHYNGVFGRLKRLDQILTALPVGPPTKVLEIQKKKPTAVLLVGSFSGLGIHSLLTVMKLFPRYFANVVFMSVGVIDSATFQGVEEVDQVREQTEEALLKYVDLARGMGIPADYRMAMGTEAITGCERLASEVAKEYERSIFFSGKLIFEQEKWWDRLLHNETAYQIQRRLQFAGHAMVVLPVRVLE